MAKCKTAKRPQATRRPAEADPSSLILRFQDHDEAGLPKVKPNTGDDVRDALLANGWDSLNRMSSVQLAVLIPVMARHTGLTASRVPPPPVA